MRHVWGRRQINAYKILVGKSESKNHLEDIRVNWRMILKWILQNRMAASGWIHLKRWRSVSTTLMQFNL
jgi:hypothetical protein